MIIDEGHGYDKGYIHFQHGLKEPVYVYETPIPHSPANIIGLPLLSLMGLRLSRGPQKVEVALFDNLPIVPTPAAVTATAPASAPAASQTSRGE